MKSENKVLFVTPIYDKKGYCLDKYLKHIKEINYPNYDLIMIDNSKEPEFYELLLSKGIKAFRVERGNNTREAITNSMNFARHYLLERDYTHMLVTESDLFPDKEVLNRLLKHDKPVVGSYYLLGIKIKTACLFVKEINKKLMRVGTRMLSQQEALDVYKTGLQRFHGCGLGCTLIKREIVERFPFWTDNRFNNKHHDTYFYMDLEVNKIPVYVDTDVLIPHQPSDWGLVEDM
jgi:hypothetical protein